MRSPASARRRGKWAGTHSVVTLIVCTAILICIYLFQRPVLPYAGGTPVLLRRLGHSAAGKHDSELSGVQQSAVAVQTAEDTGKGGIFFGEGSPDSALLTGKKALSIGAVGVHEKAAMPERVFGHGSANAGANNDKGGKVRPLGFYFQKDLKDLKHGATKLAPGEAVGSGSSLEHLQAVAKHKASKGAAGEDAALGFYFAKDIPEDVKAKSNDRRLKWYPWPVWLRRL